ncbi:MAG TPA: serine/threonine-protein kinase [Ktedonobacterales bacterium]|nr:serine/threonine-protein kinase [Ktedonobacterales bacterium]
MSQAESQPLAPGTVVQGRYEVVTPVGQGGLGTVYRVVDVLFGRSNVYALKEQWEQSPSARKQFAREGAWLKALNHPNIPKVLEYFEWQTRLYLVMNFVEGDNLERRLAANGSRPLPEGQVIAWVLPICDALHYLHTRRPPIIHRDVKPSNIVVTPAGHSVLVDLGIAKEHAPGANATATFVRKAGTEGYAPPEQYASAGQAGPWSDVYGMGATLYQLLTTQIPPTAVERVALDAPLVAPHDLNPYVSQATSDAVIRALAIRPSDRFQTVPDLKRALMAGPMSTLPAAATIQPGTGRVSSVAAEPRLRSAAAPGQPAGPDSGARRWAQAPAGSGGRLRAPAGAGGRMAGAVRTPSNRFATSLPRIGDIPAAEEPREVKVFSRKMIVVWSTLLVAAVAALVVGLTLFTRTFVPLDTSSPHATVQGYYSAVMAQDYGRAWQYTSASTKDQSLQANFASNLRADDTQGGHVLSITIVAINSDSSGHATGTVTVVRADAPGAPITESVLLTQYGDNWLIDSVSSS